jgi:hypothetical protein
VHESGQDSPHLLQQFLTFFNPLLFVRLEKLVAGVTEKVLLSPADAGAVLIDTVFRDKCSDQSKFFLASSYQSFHQIF